LDKNFDIVCSFGLIEHFVDKQAVLDVHKNFAAPNGIIIILVPMNTPLSRTFLEVHPELNLGYRELLSEKEFKDILIHGGFEIIRTAVSQYYSYDFIGAVCVVQKETLK
jgi:2-polyprenyl-3-methyl-5-hydroxy-6-metoxy-1,4-benzoquinol methylase